MTGRTLGPGSHGFSDLGPGDRIETGSVRVTADMVDRFAELSGDHFALHLSDEAARALGFAGRVAHGLLVLSLIDGLKNEAPPQLRAVASLGWDIRFRGPVLVGDTLRAVFTLESGRLARDGQRGIAVFAVEGFNQHDAIVHQGTTTLMMLP
jgi:acyl dehydratase